MSIALYRKYRPELFKDIVGQEETTVPIKNQVISGNLSHAYLFCGTRGTGKTTTAKVYAKAINCLSPRDGEPCLECEACTSPTLDIIEMDAATNNGVGDVRQLNERVQYVPSKLKYLVVIIDEVHMFSKGAFNALLKTLEEPPDHVKFILATTEPQKVPATIRSRCQIYQFNRITSKYSVERLQYVCKEEEIQIDDDALRLIAGNSDGALRDALSILDQLTSVSKHITKEMVENRLGIMNQQVLMELVESILIKDISSTLSIYRFMLDKGQDVKELVAQVIEVIRDLLVYSSSEDTDNIEGISEYISWVKDTYVKSSTTHLTTILSVLSELYNKLTYTLNPTTVGESEFIKLCSPLIGYDIDNLICRIDSLERELQQLKDNGRVIDVMKEVRVVHINDSPEFADQIITTATTVDDKNLQNNITSQVPYKKFKATEKTEEENTEKNESVSLNKEENNEVGEKDKTENKQENRKETKTENNFCSELDFLSDTAKSILNTSQVEKDGDKISIVSDVPVFEIVFHMLCKKEFEKAGYKANFILKV